MERQYGFRLLSVVAVVVGFLLATLGAVQYRWSSRIAEADLALARRRIESGAAAFGQAFDLSLNDAVAETEAVGLAALRGAPPMPLPALVSGLYSLDGAGGTRRLDSAGIFQPATAPAWIRAAGCQARLLPAIPAIAIPVPASRAAACFMAVLDRNQLRLVLIPGLLDRAYGTGLRDYRFGVRPAGGGAMFFGSSRSVPDFRQSLYGGAWELVAARCGISIAEAAAASRRWSLLFSASVEAVLLLAVFYLLVRARSKLRIADKKVLFASGLARELRGPVEALSAMVRQQASGAHGENAATRHFGELMRYQTDRVSGLLERAFQYAGIHALPRSARMQEVDVGLIVKAALAEHYPELALAGFHLEVAVSSSLPTVRGDARTLRSAFTNLLANARKFSVERRWIRVSANYLEDAREIRITIEDHGLGIDAEDMDDIFEPFTRGRRAMAANVGGAGMGLSLVRVAAEAHRGRVTVASAPDAGSAFTMHLPA